MEAGDFVAFQAIVFKAMFLNFLSWDQEYIKILSDYRSVEKTSPSSKLGLYKNGAISTDCEQCAKISGDVLRQGGNAMDAAISAILCNGVVHLQSSGIGGGFTMLFYSKKDQAAYSLNAREVAPKASTMDMFDGDSFKFKLGGKAVGVPGELMGLHFAKEKFGNPKISWKSLLEPVIELCEKGFTVTRSLANAIGKPSVNERIWTDPGLREQFIDPRTNQAYKAGDTMYNFKYGRTLRRIANEGIGAFYGGEVGQSLVKEIQSRGGVMTLEDLKSYRVRLEDAVEMKLWNRNLTFFSTPPPSSGAVMLSIIGVMNEFGLEPNDLKDSLTFHRFVESLKWAFGLRTHLSDWQNEAERYELNQFVKNITNRDYFRNVKDKIHDFKTNQDPKAYGADFDGQSDRGTSHIVVVSPDGDAVSVTTSLNCYLGSAIRTMETGIILNNHMDDFSTPGKINAYKMEPSPKNFIRPGRRPVSSMSPAIVVDENGDTRLVVGSASGPKIISATAYVILLNLFFGMNIKEAIDFPRFHHQLLPMNIFPEPNVDRTVQRYLELVGHKSQILDNALYMGIVQGISREHGLLWANNDKRKSGGVDGF